MAAALNKIAATSPSRQHPSELETSIANALYDLESNIPDMKTALRPLQFVSAREVSAAFFLLTLCVRSDCVGGTRPLSMQSLSRMTANRWLQRSWLVVGGLGLIFGVCMILLPCSEAGLYRSVRPLRPKLSGFARVSEHKARGHAN